MAWTPDLEDKLRDGWDAGKSASKIAAELSPEHGRQITRDMVIGKARRMGLEPRPSPIKRGEDA